MNVAVISGRLTRDPEVRYTTNDKGEQMCMAKFTLDIPTDTPAEIERMKMLWGTRKA